MDKKLNKKKYLQRVIIVSWIGLAICFVIKLFGGNFFEIVCTNETFIKICNYADKNLWLNYTISVIYCFISLYFFTLAILQKTKYKLWELFLIIITSFIGTAIKVFWTANAGLIFDMWQFIIMPIVFLKKDFKKYINIVIANVLLVAFQVVSLYIKNIDFGILGDSILTGTIFSIDVLLMILLYFAYSNILKNDNNNDKENKNG